MIKKTKNKNTSSQSLATNKLSTASDNTLISVLENLPIGVVVFNSNKSNAQNTLSSLFRELKVGNLLG